MNNYDVLSEMWAAWCAAQGIECRDAMEMSCDESLPSEIRFMASRFTVIWDSIEED